MPSASITNISDPPLTNLSNTICAVGIGLAALSAGELVVVVAGGAVVVGAWVVVAGGAVVVGAWVVVAGGAVVVVGISPWVMALTAAAASTHPLETTRF